MSQHFQPETGAPIGSSAVPILRVMRRDNPWLALRQTFRLNRYVLLVFDVPVRRWPFAPGRVFTRRSLGFVSARSILAAFLSGGAQ